MLWPVVFGLDFFDFFDGFSSSCANHSVMINHVWLVQSFYPFFCKCNILLRVKTYDYHCQQFHVKRSAHEPAEKSAWSVYRANPTQTRRTRVPRLACPAVFLAVVLRSLRTVSILSFSFCNLQYYQSPQPGIFRPLPVHRPPPTAHCPNSSFVLRHLSFHHSSFILPPSSLCVPYPLSPSP